MSNFDLRLKIFADGAVLDDMLRMSKKPYIKGLTTNPTLMRKAGIKNYSAFAREVLSEIKDKPISFEVFSDDFAQMEREALTISDWGENVFVKIPVTDTKGRSSSGLIRTLSSKKIKLNITALMTLTQVEVVVDSLATDIESYISIFAGRVADTGRDPLPLMAAALELMKSRPKAELIWASPRELLNIFQADTAGVHVITATSEILNKLSLVGYDLETYSLDTVKMFYRDAAAAGYSI